MTEMTDTDYRSYNTTHLAMGRFLENGVFKTVTVENIGNETLVQRYELKHHSPHHVQFYSPASRAFVMRWFPAASKPIMEGIHKAFGFIPNLMATFANSPEMPKGYLALDAEWDKTSFTPQERNFAVLAASLENECGYCIAAHSTIGKAFQKVPAEAVAVRAGKSTGDKKTDALITLVRDLVSKRGHASRATIDNFLAVGFTKTQVMELLMAVALKTSSNYLDHINPAPLDGAFACEK